MLPIFLVAMVVTGEWVDMGRDMLIGFDIMLALVLGLLLFSVSARDPQARPGIFDALQLLLVVAVIVADLMALSAIVGRISEFGFTPNRTAALGGNLVLLGNLAWSAWLYARFLGGRGPFSALVSWQANYLPVYAVWAAVWLLSSRRCSGTCRGLEAVPLVVVLTWCVAREPESNCQNRRAYWCL